MKRSPSSEIGEKGTGYFFLQESPKEKSSLPPFFSAVILLIVFIVAAKEAPCIVVDKIVAVVNGEVITQREVTWPLIPIYERYKKEYTGRRLEKKMIEAEDMILNQLIDDKLILSEAKRQGIEVTDKEIEAKLETVRNNFETEEQFRNTLAEQNVTLSELRDRFRDEIMKSKIVRKEVGWKVVITPGEVRGYYDAHIEEFMTPAKVRVCNILIKKGSRRKRDEAGFLVERIMELLDRDRDFEELAKEYSEGPNAKRGGDLGLVKKGEMMKEIDDAIFSLEAGDISNIIESDIGFHIFKVTEKVAAKVKEFEAAKSEIENTIYKERIEKNLEKWLKELRKSAYIAIK